LNRRKATEAEQIVHFELELHLGAGEREEPAVDGPAGKQIDAAALELACTRSCSANRCFFGCSFINE
jgi:hypothetical protein